MGADRVAGRQTIMNRALAFASFGIALVGLGIGCNDTRTPRDDDMDANRPSDVAGSDVGPDTTHSVGDGGDRDTADSGCNIQSDRCPCDVEQWGETCCSPVNSRYVCDAPGRWQGVVENGDPVPCSDRDPDCG